MKLFEVLKEDSQLSFLDIKKHAIKLIHNEFKLDSKTVFKPVTSKEDTKKALQDGEIVVGFNEDGSFIAVSARRVYGTLSRSKAGWISVSGDANGKTKNSWGSWIGNVAAAVKLLAPFKNVFQSVDGEYDKESSSVTSNDVGRDKLNKIEGEMQDKFSTVITKVKKETIDRLSDEVATLLKSGKDEDAKWKIRELNGIKERVERTNRSEVLRRFLRDVYKDETSIFLSDLGYALERRKNKDSKFMLKLGLYLLKMARGEQWSGRIFKGTKK